MAKKEKTDKPAVTTRTPTKQMRRRALVAVILVVGLFFSANIAKLVQLQVLQSADWQKRAVSQQLSDTVVTAKRGIIYDSDMQPLAESADVWKIIMSPKDIANLNWKNLEGVDKEQTLSDEAALELLRTRIAEGLTELFDLDYDTVYKQTGKTYSQYEVIKSKVEYKEKTTFSEWVSANGLSGAFYIITDYKRYYPQGSLASTVLGFTGTDSDGLEGLESKYDAVLSGTPGRIVTARNGIGEEMPTTMEYTKVVDAKDGGSLVTTINSTVQMYTEKYLAEAVESTGTLHRGVAIVMDVNTGAILAMSTKGDYDPNEPFTIADPNTLTTLAELSGDEYSEALSAARQLQWRNKAITDTYEPGSVFKVFTTAMGLEENMITENTTFSCSGGLHVGGWYIRCHLAGGHGTLDLPGAISASCNPYFMQVGMRLGGATFFKYFSGFGFTEKTGIDMNGEASNAGLYYGEEALDMYESSLATAAFGQTFKVTPIQMITALSAVANGGKLVTPHVVSQILDADGHVVSSTDTTVKRQIISQETSQRICKMLADAVNGGGSKNAYVPGYRVAGKTGTSEKRDTVENTADVVASFAGFAPADDPQVAVLVLLDDPQSEVRFGGTISAPVAQKIFESILPHLGVEPSYTEEELANLSRTTPNVVGQAVAAAQTKVVSSGLKSRVIGGGDTVLRQVPEAGQSIPAGGSVLLYTEETEDTLVTVPDFVGRTVNDVNTMASNAGLNVQMQGLIVGSNSTALSSAQSVEAGEKVPRGTVVRVTFQYTDTQDG